MTPRQLSAYLKACNAAGIVPTVAISIAVSPGEARGRVSAGAEPDDDPEVPPGPGRFYGEFLRKQDKKAKERQ